MTDSKGHIVYRVNYKALQDRTPSDGSGASSDAVEKGANHAKCTAHLARLSACPHWLGYSEP
jgi:hypothetical protein